MFLFADIEQEDDLEVRVFGSVESSLSSCSMSLETSVGVPLRPISDWALQRRASKRRYRSRPYPARLGSMIMDVEAITRDAGVNCKVNGEVEVNLDKVRRGDEYLRTCHTLLVVLVSRLCFIV